MCMSACVHMYIYTYIILEIFTVKAISSELNFANTVIHLYNLLKI